MAGSGISAPRHRLFWQSVPQNIGMQLDSFPGAKLLRPSPRLACLFRVPLPPTKHRQALRFIRSLAPPSRETQAGSSIHSRVLNYSALRHALCATFVCPLLPTCPTYIYTDTFAKPCPGHMCMICCRSFKLIHAKPYRKPYPKLRSGGTGVYTISPKTN